MVPEFNPGDGDTPAPTIEIPDHELLSVIGKGSYGQVWLARNAIGTYRAVKIVHRSSFTSRRPFEREMEGIRKFEPISRTHPGLVAILHVGQTEDQSSFYYVMELGDDVKTGADINPDAYESKTLANSVWDRGGASVEKCIDLALSLSDALAFLHSHDLIHRDVKPTNIVFVAGRPKLADIGLVTDTHSAKTYVGTEGFIPPEGPNSPQGDIYSLGKTLYEVCTGLDRNQFPTLPASFDEEGQDSQYIEMVEVINQACHHETASRYQSARAMHAEVTALANGKSIRRLRLLERRVAEMSRYTKLAVAVLVPVLLLSWGAYREWRNRVEDLHLEIGTYEGTATGFLNEGDYANGLKNVANALKLAPDDSENSNLQRLRAGTILNLMPTITHAWQAPSSVNSVDVHPLGESIFVAGDQSHVARYSLRDLDEVTVFEGHLGDVRQLDYHHETDHLLTVSADRTARIWNAVTGQERSAYHHQSELWSAAFGPDGTWFVTGAAGSQGTGSELAVWDVGNPTEPRMAITVNDIVRTCAISADGSLIMAGRDGGAVTFWDAESGKPAEKGLMHPGVVFHAIFIDDDRRILTGCLDGRYRIWDTASKTIIYISQPQDFAVRAVAGSPDGRFVATAGWDLFARLWDRGNGDLIDPILPHSGRVNTICFGAAGHRILTGTTDGMISLWDLAGQESIRYVSGNWAANSEGVLFGLPKESEELLVRDARSAQPSVASLKTVDRSDRRFTNPEGTFGFVVHRANDERTEVTVVDMVSREILANEVELEFPHEIKLADFHPEKGLRLIGGAHRFQIFHIIDGQSIWPAQQRDAELGGLYFSRSGEEMFVELGSKIEVLSTQSFEPIGNGIQTPSNINFSLLDPSDQVLAVCNSDMGLASRSAYLYRFRESQKPYAELRHRDGVMKVAFRPDGLRIVTSSEDATAVVWDVVSGAQIGRPMRHEKGIDDARFSRDGRFIVTASVDRSARIWDAGTNFPVSPKIPLPWSLDFGLISPDEDYVLTQSTGGGFSWTWALSRNRYPVSVLESYAEVLCGDVSKDGVSNVERWRRISTQFPRDFKVTPAEVARWHRVQAFDCLMDLKRLPDQVSEEDYDRLINAEDFHYDRFRELGGNDSPYDTYRLRVFEETAGKRGAVPQSF